MAYALFLGCNIPARLPSYEKEARAVLSALGVHFSESRRFACCGYPARSADRLAWLVSAASNMGVAEKAGRDMLVLCQCCYGSFKNAAAALSKDPDLAARVNEILAPQGLRYTGSCKIVNVFKMLHDEIGIDAIKEKVTRPLTGLVAASHTGCHSLRPSRVTEFDDPISPKILDSLISALDAKSADYPKKLECCGAPLTGSDDSLSMRIMADKLLSAKKAGAGALVTACPWCQIQFEAFGEKVAFDSIPAIPYIRLLGIAMGLVRDDAGLFSEVNRNAGDAPQTDAAEATPPEKHKSGKDAIDAGEANV